MIARGAFLLAMAAAPVALSPNAALQPLRLTRAEVLALPSTGAGAGTSGIAGIRTHVLAGNPAAPGLYTILLSVPANTKIAAHRHRDERVATIVSGTWHFGHGAVVDSGTKALGPGGFYTEPAGMSHFARTGGEPVTLTIHGFGPTDTEYENPSADPRR